MLFGHHVIDKTVDEHVREIAALASDRETLIFLDTNVLTYLYKLHEAARQEFFQWSGAVAAASRLAIPAWAANEYLSGVTSKTLDAYTPKSKEAGQAKKLLDGLLETASLFVDDASLRRITFPGNRATFLAGFRNAINALTPFTSVFSQAFEPGLIHQQIDQHLSPVILESDLSALCIRAGKEGPGRFEHRLPPGFRDGGKPENRLGDLIIWFEILEKATGSAADFPKVLYITRDEKDDWVYAPKMRVELVRGERKPVGNTRPEIKLADPRLVAEFRNKTTHSNFTIATLGTLVEGLSRTDPNLFAQLAAAIQINIEQSNPSPDGPAEAPAPPAQPEPQPPAELIPVDGPAEIPVAPVQPAVPDPPMQQPLEQAPPEAPAPRLQYDQDALQDQEYQADAPGDINEIIRALKSHSWYTQNPAILKIRGLREQDDVPPSSWFVLGRNIYQAACGNSQKAIEFMNALETQLRRFPDDAPQHLLSGMLFEIYFDSRGEFRDIAKFSYADKVLSVVTQTDFADALAFITLHLQPHRARLKFAPGDRSRTAIRIVSAPAPQPLADAAQTTTPLTPPPTNEVRSIVLDDVELLRDIVDENENEWHRLLSRNRLTPERIREQIADDLAIPKWALTLDTQPPIRADVELAMPERKEFEPKLALVGA